MQNQNQDKKKWENYKDLTQFFNLFQDRPFQGYSRIGCGQKCPRLPKVCHAYTTVMKLGTVTPYLKNIEKLYESNETHLDFC